MAIVAKGLVIGGVHEAFDRGTLAKLRVSCVLNVASELDFSELVGLAYYKIAVDDDSPEGDIRDILGPCVDVISEYINSAAQRAIVQPGLYSGLRKVPGKC